MNKVIYNKHFNDVIQLSHDKGFFLGSGNPNANILILGKEAAIDKNKSSLQYENEYAKNIEDWTSNFLLKKQFEEIDNWLTKPFPVFNSLYPYKGQKNKVESRNKENKVVRGEGGTSKTWSNYQKIVDIIFFNNHQSEYINFHEYVFCSELNQETASYSKDIPKNIRAASIEKRKELFKSDFFKGFDIVIVAVGHYIRDFDIDLQQIFEVQYDVQTSHNKSIGLKNEYINMHFDNTERPTKLLIHTNQLSMVSNELINRLSETCKEFLKNQFHRI